jgi:crotonobetainyl-CoA:carnitine CoA-transferase CaiB-like acyl-CoA transferase
MATRSTQEWIALLEGADIPCMPLHDIDSLTRDPHLAAVGMIREVTHPTEGLMRQIGVPVRLSGTPVAAEQRPAPQLGQHSVEILREAGFCAAAIESLQARGITL